MAELRSTSDKAGDSSVVGEWRISSQSKLSKQCNERPLLALAVQSGWVLSSVMKWTGVFWRMRGSNEEQRKKGCILKQSRLRSRLTGFLHKSCLDKEEREAINHKITVWKTNGEGNVYKPRSAARPEQSWRCWVRHMDNFWPSSTWYCGQAPQALETEKETWQPTMIINWRRPAQTYWACVSSPLLPPGRTT